MGPVPCTFTLVYSNHIAKPVRWYPRKAGKRRQPAARLGVLFAACDPPLRHDVRDYWRNWRDAFGEKTKTNPFLQKHHSILLAWKIIFTSSFLYQKLMWKMLISFRNSLHVLTSRPKQEIWTENLWLSSSSAAVEWRPLYAIWILAGYSNCGVQDRLAKKQRHQKQSSVTK